MRVNDCDNNTLVSSIRFKLVGVPLNAKKADCNILRYGKPILLQKNLSYASTQKEDQKLGFKIDYHLMQVKSIAECSKRAFCNTFDLH